MPRGAGSHPFLPLGVPSAAEQLHHDRGEVVPSDGAVGLGWAEHHAHPVGVGARSANVRDAGLEVEIPPGEPEDLGYSPALDEQQRHRGPEPIRAAAATNALASSGSALVASPGGARWPDLRDRVVGESSNVTASSMIVSSSERVSDTVWGPSVANSGSARWRPARRAAPAADASPRAPAMRATRSSYLPSEDVRSPVASHIGRPPRANTRTPAWRTPAPAAAASWA